MKFFTPNKLIPLFFSVIACFLVFATPVFAGCGGGGGGGGSGVLGRIQAPEGVWRYNAEAFRAGGCPTDAESIGIFIFLSKVIQFVTVLAGIITFFNLLIAGYTYITSEGNPKAHEQVRNRITYSVLGLILLVSAYTIISIISLIFFGSASFILNPTITGPTP